MFIPIPYCHHVHSIFDNGLRGLDDCMLLAFVFVFERDLQEARRKNLEKSENDITSLSERKQD